MSQKSKLDFAQAASIIGQIKSPPVHAGGFFGGGRSMQFGCASRPAPAWRCSVSPDLKRTVSNRYQSSAGDQIGFEPIQ
jgi:hypothetical protein